MIFARPEFLIAAPILIALIYAGVRARAGRLARLADAYGDHAIGRILPADVRRFPRGRLACLIAAALAICLAAAGPGETPSRNPRGAVPLDIAIVVDASLSMGATDVAPARIDRARDIVGRIAKAAPKGRLSLIVLGDWPHTLASASEDPDVIGYFARSLTGALVANLAGSVRTATGDRGATLQSAIAHARAALPPRPEGGGKRVILVISDGALPTDKDEALAAAAAAAKDGIAIWTAGIGKSADTRLSAGGRPILDPSGDPMTAGLDEALLRAVAQAGGGSYRNINGDYGARALVSGLRGLSGVAGPDDVGPQLALVCLILLAIGLLAVDGALDAGRRLPAFRRPGATT